MEHAMHIGRFQFAGDWVYERNVGTTDSDCNSLLRDAADRRYSASWRFAGTCEEVTILVK